MSTDTTVSSLRQRMIEDMAARKLGRHSQRSHIYSCRRFAAFLKRSPDTATADDIRRFQLHLVEAGLSICNRNRIMTGVKFLFRVTLRRHDLAAEIYHLKEPQKLPLTMSPEEAERLLAMAGNLKVRVMLALGYGCGLRAGEIVRTQGRRHRQRADDHPCRAVEGPQGPPRHAAARSALVATPMVEGTSDALRRGRTGQRALAISRASAGKASHDATVEPPLSQDNKSGGY